MNENTKSQKQNAAATADSNDDDSSGKGDPTKGASTAWGVGFRLWLSRSLIVRADKSSQARQCLGFLYS